MLRICLCLVLVTSAQLLHAHPNRYERDTNNQKNIIATATNIMTSNILKGNVDHIKNYVFSPLGYTSILAILSEGAKGDTLVDISSMLKHPEERSRVRLAYKSFLKGLQGDNPSIAPQFKTWFYIYKNSTVDEAFKNSIRDNYFVDVKEIDRQNFDEEEPTPTVDGDKEFDLTHVADAQRDEKEQEQEMEAPASVAAVVVTPTVATNDTTNSKDIPDFETLKKRKPDETQDETRLIDDQLDSSKFDEVVEDRQYVEVPVIREEISKQVDDVAKEVTKAKDDADKEITATVNEAVKETVESLEIMQAEARYLGQRQVNVRCAFVCRESLNELRFPLNSSDRQTGEVASALSGNSIVGRKINSRQPDKETESKMLLFNGLYYKGNWAIPFQQLRSDEENFFHVSDTEKIPVKMMRARGFYKIADCKQLKAKAIDLPYDNERYSFLVLLPDNRADFKAMLNDITPTTIPDIISQLEEEESIDISIPKFSIDTTGGIEKNLAKNGLASIFTSKADLSGITAEQKLHIEELQQHVALRVDEGSSSENFLAATNALRSNAQPEQSIVVDRPFLFFVRDVADGIIIMAGKVTSPPSDDEPTV